MTDNAAGVVAIDDGGATTVCVTKDAIHCFPSTKGHYGVRTSLTDIKHEYDFIVEYKNRKYVCGFLAETDTRQPIVNYSKSKQDIFFDLSVLIALHQYGYALNKIVVSVPIGMYNEDERKGRYDRLKGSHTITVNDITKTFAVADVKIAPETASAFWVNEPIGVAHYLDFGSRTIGYGTTLNENGIIRFTDSGSGTEFGQGIKALGKNYNPRSMAEYICGLLQASWGKYDKVYLLGGGALDTQLATYIKEYFPNAEVMEKPILANALGMYKQGIHVYGIS